MKINYISLCSGYGAECIALKRLKADYPNFDFELLAWAEIDPNAIKAHIALHNDENNNLHDITKVDWGAWYKSVGSPKVDMLFASTPCQSVSNAGKNEGMKKDSGAESALIWATEQCIATIKPDVIIYENVKGLISKRNMPDFVEFAQTIEQYGYSYKYAVLDSKNFGVAQHRERVFPIFFRDKERCQNYEFPEGFPLEKCVEDYLLEEVDENYYIDRERITNKVLSDILDQPNVRAEMEKLYHEEWEKHK